MIYSTDEIKRLITPIAEEYQLHAVFLFGSYARNDAKDNSDVDILVDTTESKIKSLLDLGGLYSDLSDCLNKELSLVTLDGVMQE